MVLVCWPHFAALSIEKLPEHSYQIASIMLTVLPVNMNKTEFFGESVSVCEGVW